jgi:hypothetical protein
MNSVALRSGPLAREGVVYTPTSLTLPGDLTYPEYEELLSFLGALHGFSRWALADALVYGEMAYEDDRYVQAALLTGLTEQSCMNYASLARRVPPSRRREDVPFSTHQEVAPLEPNAQRHWLALAEKERLTKAELRGRIKGETDSRSRSLVCPACGETIAL